MYSPLLTPTTILLKEYFPLRVCLPSHAAIAVSFLLSSYTRSFLTFFGIFYFKYILLILERNKAGKSKDS